MSRIARVAPWAVLGSMAILVLQLLRPPSIAAGSLGVGGSRAFESRAALFMTDANHCPQVWLPFMGPSLGIPHRGIQFWPARADKIGPDTLFNNPDATAVNQAWYRFDPAPLPSGSIFIGPSPENGYPLYRVMWAEPEARMRCQWISNNFWLTPSLTRGTTFEEPVSNDTCDDPSVPGCESEGGTGSNPESYYPGAPIGGGHDPQTEWLCDVYYEYDRQTGEVTYWSVLQCYPSPL
jgi:hypothetical protein